MSTVSMALQALQLPQTWQAGYTGKGVGVLFVDTGLVSQADVADRVVCSHDLSPGVPYLEGARHGTATAVSGAGAGGRGTAPDANLIEVRAVGPDRQLPASRFIEALDWALENREQYNIRVINVSWGVAAGSPGEKAAVLDALKRVARAGIITVVAAGNTGPDTRLGLLAESPDVLTVGGVDLHGTVDPSDDTVWEHSTTGTAEQPKRPDTLLPSVNLQVADPSGGYDDGWGTSFAASQMSGIVADWVQANPALDVYSVQDIVHRTSAPLHLDSHQHIAQAYDGLQAALSLAHPS